MLEYHSISALVQAAQDSGSTISALVLADQAAQAEAAPEDLYRRMQDNLHVMQEAVQAGAGPDIKSTSGLTGGDAYKMQQYAQGGGLCGPPPPTPRPPPNPPPCLPPPGPGMVFASFSSKNFDYGKNFTVFIYIYRERKMKLPLKQTASARGPKKGAENKKGSPGIKGNFLFRFILFRCSFGFGNGINGHALVVFARSFKLHDAVHEGEQRVVPADPHVFAGVDLGTSLADENAAREHGLAVGALDAEALRLAVSAVVRGPGTFFMSE